MQFLVVAWDGSDPDAPARRQAVRSEHLRGASAMAARGEMAVGGAILDDDGNMIGSACIVEMPDRAAVDEWLRTDPYVTGQVWKHVDVYPFRTAVPSNEAG